MQIVHLSLKLFTNATSLQSFWETIYRPTETFDLQINVLYQQSSITLYIKVLFTQRVSNKPADIEIVSLAGICKLSVLDIQLATSST